MKSFRRAAIAALTLLVAGIVTPAPGSSAADVSPDAPPQQNSDLGYEGYCLDNHGVTVIVDFQELGAWRGHDGSDLVRCAPGPGGGKNFSGNGLEALDAAGVDMTGTARWGTSFVCRLDGRPAADETIPRTGDPTYREDCGDTPPANAYWSYWYAENGGSWTYSALGLENRQALPGGFEGWSFSLNRTPTTNPPPDLAATRPPAYRLAGGNRFATAADVSGKYPTGVDVVYVATGRGFPDALAGSALAGRREVPVLLTEQGTLPPATVAALQRLAPKNIVVLGGATVVDNAVVTRLRQLTSGTVTRHAGTNRYDTARLVSREFPKAEVDRVYVATGDNFPDALSASARAGAEGVPVLLTRQQMVPPQTVRALEELAPREVVVIGGKTVIGEEVLTELRKHVGSVTRVQGTNRYDTAAEVSRTGFAPGVPVAYVATGENFPDALAGSALAGRTEGPVLLTRHNMLPGQTVSELARLRPQQVIVLGGSTTVSDRVLNQLKQYVEGP